MRYEDQGLLRDWSILQLRIAQAREPGAALDVSEKTIRKSLGYRKLVQWFKGQSPKGKARARMWMSQQLRGVRDLMAKAKATGETDFTLADIEISYLDANTREPLKQVPQMGDPDATE